MCSVPVGLGAKRTRLIGASCATATLDVARRAATVGTPCSPEEDVIPRRIRSRPVSATTGPRIADVVAARHEGGTEKARVAMGTGRHRRGLHRSARLRLLRLAERRARRRFERLAAGAAATLLRRSRRDLAPRRGRQDDPGGPARGRHDPAQPSSPGRNATRGRGGLPPSRLGRLDRRAHAADAAGADGPDCAAGLSLAACRAGGAGAGRLRPPRPRGSGDRGPSAEDDPPDATGAERRSRSVRRRGLGRRLCRRPRLGAAAAADRGDLVPARPHRDGPPVSGRRKGARRERAPAPALLGSRGEAARTQAAGARAGHPRPLAANRRAHARVSA